MKILITGAAGFIGSHLVDSLSFDNEVYGVDDMSGGKWENVKNTENFYKADCRDTVMMDRILKDVHPDVVYHLAANAAENKAQFSPIDITSRNYSAFINTLTPFIKYGGRKFIFTSSIAVYGNMPIPYKEVGIKGPEDLYGITKLAIESTIGVMANVHEFGYVIVRPHNVYGPRQNMTDPYRNVMTIWMNAILKNKPYYIYGDGEQKRCFTYIDDVIQGLISCLEITGMTFNLGADASYTLNDLSRALQKVTGTKQRPIYLPQRPQEVKEAIADHTMAKKYLDYEDKTDLEEGMKKTWDWVKSVGYQEPKYTEFEIYSNKIPKNWLPV